MADAPRRNDPCFCGSGRKYKNCCLRTIQETDERWRRLREAEGVVVPEILHFALDRWGKAYVEDAWRIFSGEPSLSDDTPEHPEFETAFVPWLSFGYCPARRRLRRGWPTRPAALEYLDENRRRIPELQQSYIEAAVRSPLTFVVVTGMTPGRDLSLRDILTGRTHRVLERSASTMLSTSNILLTRVVSVDDVSMMVGCAPWVIPPSWHNVIIDFREQHQRAGGPLDEAAVSALHLQILGLYREITNSLLHPRLPKLQNTDGDPLAPTTLHFELRCSPREAFDRLKSLALDRDEDALLSDATWSNNGELEATELLWAKKGNKLHPDWDNTTLGTLHVAGRRLTASVNSERRAKKLRALIEKRLAGDVLFVRQVTESIEAELERPRTRRDEREQAEEDRLQAQPEVQAMLREQAARHWDAWLDMKLPALGNVSPRQAAGTPVGRERLEALFAEFAWRNEQLPPASRPDVSALRARLGI